jgi:hypothetical protein
MVRRATQDNFEEKVLKTFQIQLFSCGSVNVMLLALMVYFMWRINQRMNWCYEGFAFLKPAEVETQTL